MRPLIFINYKTYREATGEAAERLTRACEEVSRENDIRVAVQATDVYRIASTTSLPVWAQHCDPAEPGQSTGWNTVHAAATAGAAGTFINHSEHPVDHGTIPRLVGTAADAGLETIVFVPSVEALRELREACTPTYFCIEPPELIGGDVSVSTAHPELIRAAVEASPVPVLTGAGVKTGEDLRIAAELGSAGVILASGIVLAQDRTAAFARLLSERSA